jgi:hypothetical protein
VPNVCALLVPFITGKTPVLFISSDKFMRLEDLEIFATVFADCRPIDGCMIAVAAHEIRNQS